jgi:hypothetical protein
MCAGITKNKEVQIGLHELKVQIVNTSSILKAMSLVWWTSDVNPSTTINRN